MARMSFEDSVKWIFSFATVVILLAGNASANKEGYYGKYIGKLSQLHHGVSGDVFAVDGRTLHLRNFNYDGEGPAAYFYAGNSKAPGVNGFRLRDERGTTNVLPRYRNKHITITLPEGKTLQNIRWFSVWCDEFSVNFGDVKIPKNLDFPKPQKINGLNGVHGVSSEPIVIVDAQTLLIPSFSYDGEAPDAKFWVGRGLKPSPQGIRIPDENGKITPLRRYDRKTIVLTLPGDLTIFDIGHFGVWCEAFTVDFGHVQIPRGLNIPPSLKMLGVSPQVNYIRMAAPGKQNLNELAIENFRKYLRIPSVQPNVNYDECVKFLKQQSVELGLEFKVHEIVKSKPIVILTWRGTCPELPSILLNSHMDVVPVFPEFWKHGPFDAEVDANGNIYARGAQDMKCVAIQYMEAIRRLILKGQKLRRDVHLSFVPDEEIGGIDGMKKFVNTQEFKNLNVGFALDEGYSSTTSTVFVFNAERNIWQIEFTCPGSEGHGSLLLENTAGEKLRKLIDRIMDFRQTQVEKLKSNKSLTVGDVTTVNLTITKGGVEPNVVPPELSVTFDFRLSLDVDVVNFENQIKRWMKEAGDGIQMKWIQKNNQVPPTKVDSSNSFWTAIKRQFDEMNLNYRIATFPGGTDGRYCREVGIPVIGFSPIVNTPILLHAHDEFLNKDVFLRGIDVYENVIPAIANL